MPVHSFGLRISGGRLDTVLWQDPVSGHYTLQRLTVVPDGGHERALAVTDDRSHGSLREALDAACALGEQALRLPPD